MPLIIGAGGSKDRAAIPLSTRAGRFIPNERRPEFPPARLRAAADLWKRERPDAKLRSSTSVYNCTGLVFASRRTWVDPTYLDTIFADDEYYRVTKLSEIQIGDVVVYQRKGESDPCHVAIIAEIAPKVGTASWEIKVMSKWGADGEYIHLLEDVPEIYGEPSSYWTERRPKQ